MVGYPDLSFLCWQRTTWSGRLQSARSSWKEWKTLNRACRSSKVMTIRIGKIPFPTCFFRLLGVISLELGHAICMLLQKNRKNMTNVESVIKKAKTCSSFASKVLEYEDRSSPEGALILMAEELKTTIDRMWLMNKFSVPTWWSRYAKMRFKVAGTFWFMHFLHSNASSQIISTYAKQNSGE